MTDNNTNSDGSTSFFGPASVVGADGEKTKYSYTPLGQVATKVIYSGSSESVEYDYLYDAAGNVVTLTQSPVNASGAVNGNPLVTDYDYDAQGRPIKEIDNVLGTDITANRTTSTIYSFDGTYNIATTTNPDNSTSIIKSYLDGTTAGIGGTAQTPATYTEGVVTSTAPDSQGWVVTAGSTWVMSSTNGGQAWTKTYTNILGEVYLVQQSEPGSGGQPGQYVDSFTSYDANGRPTKNVDVTGVTTRTIHNPWNGQVGATWVDVIGDGQYDAGIDSKTLYTASDGQTDTKVLSTTGVQDDTTTYSNGGLIVVDNSDGLITTSETSYSSNGYTVLTTNPDGTQVQDIYTDGLLTEEDQLDNGEGLIASTTYAYNGMRELASQTDPSTGSGQAGTTTYTYFEDGTQKSETDPGQNPVTTNTLNNGTDDPTKVTNSDGTTTSQTEDSLGQTVTQSGAGVIAAKYGYNSQGQLTSLTTYPGGDPTNTDDPGAATTTWNYDNATGLLQQETFADGTQDSYKYNAAGQMISEIEPGMSGTFGYDDYGNAIDSTYVDSTTGLVKSTVDIEDDLGQPLAITDTDNGQTYTETDTYTPLEDLKSETFGSAGNTSVNYGYYPVSSTGTPDPNASPDALESMTVSTPGGASTQQVYAYDPTSKRLASITVNGVVISYKYQTDSNQIASITAQPAGGNALQIGVTTTFSPDSADGSQLGEISVDATANLGHGNTDEQTVYDGSYTYNANGQRATDVVTQSDSDGNSSTQTLNYTYDPNQADALTKVTDASGNVLYSYSYDGVGNFAGTSLGDANNVNEYASLTYNARHDLTNDGTYTYGYDALDRLTSVTPDTPSSGSTMEQYGYDGQGRRLWENVYAYNTSGGSWGLSYSRHFVWSGAELVEELDGNNNVLQQYTWGQGEDGTDQVLALTDYTSGTAHTYVLVYDASGNAAMMLDPTTGAVVANYAYTPYGALVSESGPEAGLNPFLGKGYWTDAAAPDLGWAQPSGTGTVRQTKYSLGLWMEDDPTGFNGGLNPTQVDGGDPINYGDPQGTWPVPTTLDTPPPSTGPDTGEMLQREFAARRAAIASGATTPAQIEEAKANSYAATDRLKFATIHANWDDVSPAGNLWNVVSGLPGAYWDTMANGQQSDAFFGYWDALTNAVSAGHGSNYGPSYGHQSDYDTGHTMGDGAGFVINMVITVSGVGGIVKGVQTVAAAGGLLQIAAVALNDGRVVAAIVQNGHAVIATAETLVGAGMTADGAANVLYQIKNSGGSSPAPNGGATKYLHGGPEHDAAIDEYINNRVPNRATNIRKNQVQVDVNGQVVGNNRPDIQYDYNGRHYVVEVDNDPASSSAHAVQIRQNDPNVDITQIGLGK